MLIKPLCNAIAASAHRAIGIRWAPRELWFEHAEARLIIRNKPETQPKITQGWCAPSMGFTMFYSIRPEICLIYGVFSRELRGEDMKTSKQIWVPNLPNILGPAAMARSRLEATSRNLRGSSKIGATATFFPYVWYHVVWDYMTISPYIHRPKT